MITFYSVNFMYIKLYFMHAFLQDDWFCNQEQIICDVWVRFLYPMARAK
jgi:hypothetical protein